MENADKVSQNRASQWIKDNILEGDRFDQTLRNRYLFKLGIPSK